VGAQTTLGPSPKSSIGPGFRHLCNVRNDNSHNSAVAESGIFTRFNVITDVRSGTVSSSIQYQQCQSLKMALVFPISKSLIFGNLILIAKTDMT